MKLLISAILAALNLPMFCNHSIILYLRGAQTFQLGHIISLTVSGVVKITFLI